MLIDVYFFLYERLDVFPACTYIYYIIMHMYKLESYRIRYSTKNVRISIIQCIIYVKINSEQELSLKDSQSTLPTRRVFKPSRFIIRLCRFNMDVSNFWFRPNSLHIGLRFCPTVSCSIVLVCCTVCIVSRTGNIIDRELYSVDKELRPNQSENS